MTGIVGMVSYDFVEVEESSEGEGGMKRRKVGEEKGRRTMAAKSEQ